MKGGYLDTVLDLTASKTVVRSVWVEVKIDAPESGSQCKKYGGHIAAMPEPRPRLITLSREPLPGCGPCLYWADLYRAAGASRAWADFSAFLVDRHLDLDPRVSGAPIKESSDQRRTIFEAGWSGAKSGHHSHANLVLKRRFPAGKPQLFWTARKGPAGMEQMVNTHVAQGKGYVTSGGPLRYGYVTDDPDPYWSVRVIATGIAP